MIVNYLDNDLLTSILYEELHIVKTEILEVIYLAD